MRPLLAVCAGLLTVGIMRAGEPQPLWEIDVRSAANTVTTPASKVGFPGNLLSGKEKPGPISVMGPSPGWLSFSPDGRSIVAVIANRISVDPERYHYQLRVWNSLTRKQRFSADLGDGRAFHFGDDLASFPSNDTILTGGANQAVYNLEKGLMTTTQQIDGLTDHTVWSVPDLRETYYLRREPHFGVPAELFFQSAENIRDPYSGRRFRFNEQSTEQTTIRPPREGLEMEPVAMNFARTRLVAAFKDVRADIPLDKLRHALVMYQIKTIEEFELVPVSEAVNPHMAPITAISFARNGRTLATGAENGSIALWDVTDGVSQWKPRAVLEGVCNHRVYSLAFSRDWRIIAAVTWEPFKPNLLLIDADTGKLLQTVRLSEREQTTVAFSPDCLTILTGSASGKIQGWDLAGLLKGN